MLEAPLVKKILGKLRDKGGFWYKAHGGPYQQAGLPDIVGCYRGRFYGFEVKRPQGGDATPLQAATLRKIKAAGGVAAVIRSFEEALALLDEG